MTLNVYSLHKRHKPHIRYTYFTLVPVYFIRNYFVSEYDGVSCTAVTTIDVINYKRARQNAHSTRKDECDIRFMRGYSDFTAGYATAPPSTFQHSLYHEPITGCKTASLFLYNSKLQRAERIKAAKQRPPRFVAIEQEHIDLLTVQSRRPFTTCQRVDGDIH